MILFWPQIIVPDSGNPTVESTVITEESTGTFPIALVLGVIVNVPWILSVSAKPKKRSIL